VSGSKGDVVVGYLSQATHARLEEFLSRDHPLIGEAGKSIVMLHERPVDRVVVLLHGFTASPTQFIEFGRQLYERGYNVFVPRLPRHGYRDRLTDALAELSAEQMKDMTTQAVEIARGLAPNVTIVGFSLGGSLGAWAAAYHRLDRVILVAPFLGVAWIPQWLAPAIAMLTLRAPNRFAWWHPIKRENLQPEHGYPRYSTHAVAQAYRIVHDVFADAAQHALRARRVVVVTNARETTVNNRAARNLVRRWQKLSPGSVETFEFTDLRYSHDIIEPLRSPDLVAQVYPKLLEIVER